VQGQEIPFNPQGEFFLLGGADPYFTNVNNTSGNQPYLSQDLRVFTGTPAANDTPAEFAGIDKGGQLLKPRPADVGSE
jgi:hypothetical protein